jgi:hypothetical protein
MGITPIIRDDNGIPLAGRGSQIVTKRYVDVGQTPQDIAFSVDVKEVVIHLEGATIQATLTGTASGSEPINWTSDGVTLPPIAVAGLALETLLSVATPSGARNVSVLAWR